jgi:O-antigen/teichoic acid export membrane protein
MVVSMSSVGHSDDLAVSDTAADDRRAGALRKLRFWFGWRSKAGTGVADESAHGRGSVVGSTGPGVEGEGRSRRLTLTSVTGRIATSSILVTAIGFLTGPIQARALGPVGRGDLAAIALPLAVAPTLLSLGLGTYLMRESARRRSLGVLVGSVGSILILFGLVAAVLAPPLARLFAGDRPVVYRWLLIGFLTMPLSMFSWVLSDLAYGLERWTMLIARQVMVPVLMLTAYAILYLVGALTVASAAAVTITVALLSALPLLPLVRRIGRPHFERAVFGEGIRFGGKAWLGGLGSLVNVRLDQLLMTRLVAPRELGLYVVAVTASGFFVSPLMNGLISGVIPRSAAEEYGWLGRVLRVTLMLVLCIGAVIALSAPVAIPLVFGSSFDGAVPMVWILVLGSIPLAGVNILSTVLTLGGRPGFSAVSELVAVGLTIPALIVVLPIWGGVGAAMVSLVAYTLNFTVLLFGAKRHVGATWGDLLIVRRADLAMLRDRLVAAVPSRVTKTLPARLGGRSASGVSVG